MYICGIDLSLSGTGLIVLSTNNDIITSALISTRPALPIENRISIIWKYISNTIKPHKGDIKINIEGLAYALRGQRSLELAGLHYYIRTNLTKKKITFAVTPPTTLKKFVTGKGNCKKNLMLLSVYKKWGQSFTDDNLADSYSLARYINTEDK